MILNLASDGVLSVLLALRRAVLAYGPMPRQRLLDLCTPVSLRQGAGAAEPPEAGEGEPGEGATERASNAIQTSAHRTLTRWRQAGLFMEADDQAQTISLAPGFDDPGLESSDLGPVRTAIRRLVLHPKNNLDIVASTTKSEVAGVCGDFTRALSWVLAQDVYTFPGGGNFSRVEDLENEQFGSKKGTAQSEQRIYVFQNNTRWAGFRTWAPFLGFGWWSPMAKETHLVIDPTEALTDELPEVFGRDEELPIAAFVARTAERLPVLDGGAYREAIVAILQRSAAWQVPASNELSTALSRALIRLSEAGMIDLYDQSDAPQRRALLGRGGTALQQVTHIARRRL